MILSEFEGLAILILYGLIMFFISRHYLRNTNTVSEFIVGDRKINWIQGSFSIAATWIWAPALFISSLKSYNQGIAGLFWFTVPNILCLIIFSYFAVKIRDQFPNGFTLSEYMHKKYSTRVKNLYLIELGGLAICQYAVQLLAGAAVIVYLSGLNFLIVTIILAIISLSYSIISGIRASILTDYWQMLLILLIVVILIPWVIVEAGGFKTVLEGIGGKTGEYSNIFNSDVAYSFGIVVTIGLLAGPFGDQSFWQRTFSLKKDEIKKTFYLAAAVFGVVPIFLGLLGFIAASRGIDGEGQLINIITIKEYLPTWTVVPFAIMLISGLVSTLDSSLCAISSLTATHLAKNKIKSAKISMIILTVIGLIIANIPNMKILYLFLFYGTLRASVLLPTILTLLKMKLSEKGVFYGICVSIFIGAPVMAFGNFGGYTDYKVLGALISVFSSGIIAIFFTLHKK